MTISAETYSAAAKEALQQIERGLRLLRSLDENIYWDLAAASCDAADNLRSGLMDLLPDQDTANIWFDDHVLDPHRAGVSRRRPHALGVSGTASALDMTSLARNLLIQRPVAKRVS